MYHSAADRPQPNGQPPLAALLAGWRGSKLADTEKDGTAASVATRERAEWAEVRAGKRAFVRENLFYVTTHEARYRQLFGIDPKSLQDCGT